MFTSYWSSWSLLENVQHKIDLRNWSLCTHTANYYLESRYHPSMPILLNLTPREHQYVNYNLLIRFHGLSFTHTYKWYIRNGSTQHPQRSKDAFFFPSVQLQQHSSISSHLSSVQNMHINWQNAVSTMNHPDDREDLPIESEAKMSRDTLQISQRN